MSEKIERKARVVTSSGTPIELSLSHFYRIKAWLAAFGGNVIKVSNQIGESISTIRAVRRRKHTDDLNP